MFNLLATPDMIMRLDNIPGVAGIYPDSEVTTMQATPPRNWITSAQAFRATGVDVAHLAGLTGKGVKIVVLDTSPGFPPHPAMPTLAGETLVPPQFIDGNGHGTHVCGTIGARKWTHPVSGIEMMGVAPGAQVYAIKILSDPLGAGRASDIIAGIDLALQRGADIISMSLGGDAQVGEAQDPLARAVNRVANQAVVCIASGNAGPQPGTIASPGIASGAITVGAYGLTDGAVAHFSSRGPTVDGLIRPDVVAPGGGRRVAPDIKRLEVDEYIYNATTLFSALDGSEDKQADGAEPMRGSSMATPFFAGVVALLMEKALSESKPKPTAADLKRIMAAKGHAKDNAEGWGLVQWKWFEPGAAGAPAGGGAPPPAAQPRQAYIRGGG